MNRFYKKKIRDYSDDELIEYFIEFSNNHGMATESGNYKFGNKEHDKLILVIHELQSRGIESYKKLLLLMYHDSPGVRAWSAFRMLEIDPGKAELVLEKDSKINRSLVSFSVDQILKQWRDGKLIFY